MKFITLAGRSGAGAGVALFLYALVVGFMVGNFAAGAAIFASLFTGAIVGIMFAIAHLRRQPSFASSLATAAVFIVGALALSLLAGTFVGFSAASVLAMTFAAVLLGTGAYIGSKIGS